MQSGWAMHNAISTATTSSGPSWNRPVEDSRRSAAGILGIRDPPMNILQKMRQDWNLRAKEDANFYVAFARENQTEEEFLASAREVVVRLESEFSRLPSTAREDRRALEIGCGPGRLMLPMSKHFGETR